MKNGTVLNAESFLSCLIQQSTKKKLFVITLNSLTQCSLCFLLEKYYYERFFIYIYKMKY